VKRPGGLKRNPVLVIEALVLTAWVECLLRRRTVEQALWAVASVRAKARDRYDLSETFLRANALVHKLVPFEQTCLKQALVLCAYRRRRGLAAVLRIGVQKDGAVFGAHAWVEDDRGNALTDPQAGYSPVSLQRSSNERATR
jgi:hypothetical protein